MATKTLSENIQTAITDLSNIKTALIGKGVTIPTGTQTNTYSGLIDDMEIGGGASAEFNIHYGDVPPEDLSKLWVKTTPALKVTLDSEITSVIDSTVRINDVMDTPSGDIVSGYGGCAERVDNLVYLLGGYTKSPTILTYNLDTFKTVSTGVTMPSSYFREGASGRVGNFIYLLGGLKYETMSRDIYQYNISDKIMIKLDVTIPSNNDYGWRNFGYGTVGTKIYLFGGYCSTSSSSSNVVEKAYYFDTETQSFTQITSPKSNFYDAATTVMGTDIYLIGGYSSRATTSITKYDTLSDKYSVVAHLPETLTRCRAAVVGKDIYIYGDHSIFKFDTIANSVSVVASDLEWKFNNGTIVSYGTDIFNFCGRYLANGAFKTITDVTLETDHLLISSLISGYSIKLFNTDGIDIKLPVSNVFKGDINNKAQKVKAYYYNNDQWHLI